jgi:predicted nucleic acid-binding protein
MIRDLADSSWPILSSLRQDEQMRDPDDQPVLQTLLASEANYLVNYLVTGDKDLPALATATPSSRQLSSGRGTGG